MKITYLCFFMVLGLALTGFSIEASAQAKSEATAAISKVDGDGVAKVRRKSGIESVAGVKQELFPGDRITTDTRSIVELILADGTLVRVGLNSEYKLESVESKTGIFSWAFTLTKGSIRALVEKNPKKGVVKFRVNTPVGTMGVRGTELVLDHNPKTKRTTLHTIEGRVEFGAKNCRATRTCVEVATGETAWVDENSGSQKIDVQKFEQASLLLMNEPDSRGEGGNSGDANLVTGEDRLARASLFEDLKKAELTVNNSGGSISAAQKEGLEKIIKDASEAMAAAQDALLDRTKSQREQAQKDIESGAYAEKLKLAEKFDDLTSDTKKSGKDRSRENLSGTIVQKKLAMAEAILRSKKMKQALAKAEAKNDDIQDKIDEVNKKFNEAKMAKQATADVLAKQAAEAEEAQKKAEQEKLKKAQELLDKPLADAILSEETVVLAKERYSYEEKECFIICWYETKTREEATHTVKTKVERSSGICYEKKKDCKRQMIPCDLKSGKSCKPKFTDYECKETKVEVPCPSGKK